jgi:hypothetical protein
METDKYFYIVVDNRLIQINKITDETFVFVSERNSWVIVETE